MCTYGRVGAWAHGRAQKPAADVLAAGSIELNLEEVEEGDVQVKTWRGKPLFVQHRTAEQIAAAEAVDIAILRDPETDAARTIDPKYLLVIGICTHLGVCRCRTRGTMAGTFARATGRTMTRLGGSALGPRR